MCQSLNFIFISSIYILYLYDSVLSIKTENIAVNKRNITTQKSYLKFSLGESVETDADGRITLPKLRAKRQSGENQYMKSSRMPQMKLLRLFLQMFRNLWDPAYVGGGHPMHPDVPKGASIIYRAKIYKFFFPDIETKDKKKE